MPAAAVDETLSSAASKLVNTPLMTILYTIVTIVACLIAKKVLNKLFKKLFSRTRLDVKIREMVLKLLNGIMWFLIVVILCDRFDIDVTSFVALFSVAGIAISLAIQNSLSNFAGGIMLLSGHPFKPGDYVEAGGQEGTVQSVGLIYTQMTTADNKMIFIPNSTISSGKILNYSSQPKRRVEIKISASYDDPTETVKAAVNEVIDAEPRILRDPAPMVALLEYGDSAITYVIRVWVKNSDFWDVKFALNEALRPAFERHNIEMTYNHLNVHIMDESK